MEAKIKKERKPSKQITMQIDTLVCEIASIKQKLIQLTNEKVNFVNTLEETKKHINFNLDSKKYRDTQERDISTLQISNQSTMAIITHYLELIRDYMLRMKSFTNNEIEHQNNTEGKYLNSDNSNSESSPSHSSESSGELESP